ncbi:bifunctional 4-carboxymuconolactone decarboxylase/3-oxoadipate enol-lactonase PcaCD [Piscinibacter terrae]|uniref:Alpha/beta fold hydrolase n=1 Tax=Piscinibacter terrae TaxID=2496871 RepID=A0A3N7K2A1_9BURK|nr:alpha/beta fold hydrolase [Albitalea terrae]RQP25065.1 alpha/beta fold hydrolase [Albitalea terrae]
MSQQDDFDRGMKNRRAVLGDEWVDKSLNSATAFNAEFQAFFTRYAWHDIWGRPGLDHTTRRLLVLGMTMALARWEEFEVHCRGAVRHGVPLEKIKETLMQGAIYCGVPAANTAFKIAMGVLREEGLVPAPQSLAADARIAQHHTFSEPQLRVAVQGKGAPVMLAHALGLDHTMWDDLAARLATTNLVARYDQVGHGGSAVPPGPYTLDQMVDHAARIVREWGQGPVVWVGLSMGGMVGQGLAIRYPELVKGLVLANTTSQYPQEAQAGWSQRIETVNQQGMQGIVQMVVERYLSEEFRRTHPAFTQALRETLLRSDPAGYAACCHGLRDVNWTDRLREIRVPTLVLAGGKDVGTPPSMAKAIAERISGAVLHQFDGAAHLSVAEAPDEFEQQVRSLLARIG